MFKTIAVDPERRAEILKMVGRMFLILLPVIGVISFFAFFVWTVRRRGLLEDAAVVEPVEEPTYEAAEPLPV